MWSLTDHACGRCFGRVLMSVDTGEFRCAECGHSGHGEVGSVCCCGVVVAGKVGALECYRNDAVSDAVPQEVLVRERPKASERSGRRSAPVSAPEF